MKNIAGHSAFLILAAIIAITAVLLCFAPITCQTAFAGESDAFETVFPNKSYFQSKSPALISANDRYLAVYDDVEKTIYSRDEQTRLTRVFTTSLDGVTDINVVGQTLFVTSGDGVYSLELSNASAEVEKATLPQADDTLFSDGNRLYLKSVTGKISVYNEKLEPVYDSVSLDALIGKPVVTAEGDNLYIFTYQDGKLLFCTYNFSTKTETSTETALLAQSARAGKNIYVSVNGLAGKPYLTVLDKAGNTIYETDISPVSYKAYDDKLYTINEKGQIAIFSTDSNGKPIPVETVGMSGADDSHLDAPTDAIIFDNKTVIADAGNSRLAFIDADDNAGFLPLASAPTRLASNANEIVAATEDNSIVFISSNTIGATYQFEKQILDIAYLDKLYILSNDGVYVLLGGRFLKFADADATKMCVTENGSFVYLMSSNGVSMLGKDGKLLNTSLDYDLSNAIDFSVDYCGNIYVLFENSVVKLKNDVSALSPVKTYRTYNPTLKATPVSISISNDQAYFCAKECLVGKLRVDAASKDSYTEQQKPTLSGNEKYSFYRIKNGVESYYSADSGRADCAANFNDETALVLDVENAHDGFLYALKGGNVVEIPSSDFEAASPLTIETTYISSEKTDLYKLPGLRLGMLVCEKGITFTAIDDAAGYDGYLRVSYNDNVYFVKASSVKPLETVQNETKVYGKAKAERIGGKVEIYSAPDASSESLVSVVDGTRLEIIDTLDGYYKVRYGNVVGYVSTDKLLLNGLTNVQIIAIVVTVLVALAGLAVFITVYKIKKRGDQ